VPMMLRWAMAYELRDEDVLLVAPAVPHEWITGADPLRVQGIPTRWGAIDLRMGAADGAVQIEVDLPEPFEAELHVHLPLPADCDIADVRVEGGRRGNYLAPTTTIIVHDPAPLVTIGASYGQAQTE
jgi:hypothetical protein